ncbi:MAG: VCBS repeat-containing protein, partial [Gammaproteobacteria bacterium]|nr:VCBS repeat-containing protein [Gammaproteobacteria bacterium]
NDTHTAYQAGSKLQKTKRLSNIQTHAQNTLVRTYNLAYQYQGSPEKSQLTSVEECVSGQCLPKTEFEWQTSDVSWLQEDDYAPEKLIVDSDGKDRGVRLRDVNGDGLVDFIYSKGSDRKTYLNTGSGWSENSNYQLSEPIIDDDEDKGVRFLDVNGDGLLDYIRGDQDYKKVYLNTGSGWQLSTSFKLPYSVVRDYNYTYPHCDWERRGARVMVWNSWSKKMEWEWEWEWVERCYNRTQTAQNQPSGMQFAELNGDGLIDIVYGRDNYKQAYLNNGTNWVKNDNLTIPVNITKNSNNKDHAYQQMGVRIIDINNDGLSDIVKALDNEKKTYINKGNYWQESYNYRLPKSIQTDVYEHNSALKLIDINGDGLPDVLYGKGDDKSVHLNTGNGWSTTHNFTLPKAILTSGNEDTGIRFVDINSDGLIDVLDGADTNRKTYYNTGHSWIETYDYQLPVQTTTSNHKDSGTRFTDLNGDGLIDILQSKDNTKTAYLNQGTHT